MKKALLLAAMAACAPAQVKYEDILKGPGSDWLTYSGDYAGHRHSPLGRDKIKHIPNH